MSWFAWLEHKIGGYYLIKGNKIVKRGNRVHWRNIVMITSTVQKTKEKLVIVS